MKRRHFLTKSLAAGSLAYGFKGGANPLLGQSTGAKSRGPFGGKGPL